MAVSVLDRFNALEAAFAAQGGPRLNARFAAAAGLGCTLDPAVLAARAAQEHHRINAALPAHRHPAKSLRLVFAAALAASGRSAHDFLHAREALIQVRHRRGGRSLSHAATAALTLAAAGGGTHQADMFFDILEAVAAPWWRRHAMAEECFAAALAAAGETPEDATSRLARADRSLKAAGLPGRAATRARFEVALSDPREEIFLPAWTALSVGARSRPGLVKLTGHDGLAVLASRVQDGSAAADALVRAAEFVQTLRPKPYAMVAGKLAIRLALAELGDPAPAGPVRDLAAILMAQAAATAAVAASTAAVVAAA